MSGLRVLDLFCGAGGAGMGYRQAGFDVVGVDLNPQPRYPFAFIQHDALTLDMRFIRSFDAIHASPPCQAHTRKPSNWGRKRVHWHEHLDLIPQARAILKASGLPYVIENVEGAPLRSSLMLCGTMFGLRIVKHRHFEASFPLEMPASFCDHSDVYNPWEGKPAQSAAWGGLPIDGLLRDALPFEFLNSDIPIRFMGSGVIASSVTAHPATLNEISKRELERALKFYEYVVDPAGGKGGHQKWTGPDRRAFSVPTKDPVSRDVFKNFLGHFGLKKDDYIRRVRPKL